MHGAKSWKEMQKHQAKHSCEAGSTGSAKVRGDFASYVWLQSHAVDSHTLQK